MLTFLEVLIIIAIIPALIWPLLPVKQVPRFLDFMPLASVVFLILHLFIDNEAVRVRFIPLYIFTVIFFLINIAKIFRHNPNQPKRRVLAGVNRVFSLLLLVVSILVPTVILPFKTLPQPTGNFNIGTVVSDFTDSNRMETLSKETGKPREIAVQFWYPTDDTSSESGEEISGAPISTEQQSYPVLIFSHGAFGMRKSNASTCRELASHGYIVASIDHTYHSFYTSFADGRSAIVNNQFLNEAIGASIGDIQGEELFKMTHEWLNVRTADIELLIDSLEVGKLETQAAVLNGHMDLTKIGLFGHSLGGAAAAEVSKKRDEVKSAIDIDGTMIGDITGIGSDNKDIVTKESFNKPLMLMYNSSYEQQEAKETSYMPNVNAFNNSTKAAYSLCIKDSGHLNFTDLPRISPFLSKKLGIGAIDSFECIKIVNDYTLAFFDETIKGQHSTLLDGTTNYKEVEFEKRIPGDTADSI